MNVIRGEIVRKSKERRKGRIKRLSTNNGLLNFIAIDCVQCECVHNLALREKAWTCNLRQIWIGLNLKCKDFKKSRK